MIVDGLPREPRDASAGTTGLGSTTSATDAMPPVGGQQSKFDLYGTEIQVVGGRCGRPDGTLAGSTLNMAAAIRNCVQMLGGLA